MNKINDKIILIISSIILFILSIFVIDFSFVKISDLTVFISIIIGYQITSISILFNSKILSVLHKEQDNVYVNTLNRIAYYYQHSILWGITFVLYLIFLDEDLFMFNINNIIIKKSSFFASFSFIIFYLFIRGNFIFFKIFVLPRNE